MKEQYQTPNNAYVEFRFESSLRKYQKLPSKKIKCCAGKCNHSLKNNMQISKAERLSRLASTVRINVNSNEKYRNNSRQVSPLGLKNVSDFNIGTRTLDKVRVRECQKNHSLKASIQLSDFQHSTPLKKKQTRETPSQRQDLCKNCPFSPKQNSSQIKNSFQNRCSENIVFNSNEDSSKKKIEGLNQNQNKGQCQAEELKNFRDIVGQQMAIEQQESQIIGNIDLLTEQKNNVINHLESILRDKESPLAEYLFQMFDVDQNVQEKTQKTVPKREKREDDLDTPFSKINMSLSVSQRKQLRGQILFEMQGRQTGKCQPSSFSRHSQVHLDRQEEQGVQVCQQILKQQPTKKKIAAVSPEMEEQQSHYQQYSVMQVQQKNCESQKMPLQQCQRLSIRQASNQLVQNQDQKCHSKLQKTQNLVHKTQRKRKRDSFLYQLRESKDSKQSHLKIRTGPIQCLLSLRVFNKFIKPYENIESIVGAILKTRPYLSQGKQDLMQAIKIYLNRSEALKDDTLI